jgi:hypothetical protein
MEVELDYRYARIKSLLSRAFIPKRRSVDQDRFGIGKMSIIVGDAYGI